MKLSATNITFDPHNKFKHLSNQDLANSVGALLYWAQNWREYGSIRKALEEQYRFFISWSQLEQGKAWVDNEGTFTYPGDPDHSPILVIRNADEICYIYPYAIVAILSDEGNVWTRMD